MKNWTPAPLLVVVAVVVVVGVVLGRGRAERRAEDGRRAEALALCTRWADDLDKKTTDTGVYVRWEGDTLPDADPWGRPLRVSYSQGGSAEYVEVRSVGPDGQPHTADDVAVTRVAMNLKGVGTGIKKGAEETAANTARGAVKGTVEGVRDALGRGRKKGEEKDAAK